MQILKYNLRQLVSQTERAPNESQCAPDDRLTSRLLASPRERDRRLLAATSIALRSAPSRRVIGARFSRWISMASTYLSWPGSEVAK